MAIRVLIYEDNEALRQGMVEWLNLSEGFAVCGAFGDCGDVITQVESGAPDVILLDIELPGISGIDALKKIRSFSKTIPVIMLTVFDDTEHVFDAICAGASGYLLKRNVSEKLAPAIIEVLEGGAPMSPAIAKKIILSMQRPTIPDYRFTAKEQEVLRLLCKGLSYKMIAAEIGLAFETIRSYIKSIYGKLQVHSATEAVSKAIQERLI